MLQTLLERLGSARGTEFFDRCVCALGETLDLPYVMVGELAPGGDRIRTLAVWNDGALALPAEYPLYGACWEQLPVWLPGTSDREARSQWPDDSLLSDIQAESCAVVVLSDPSDHPIGILLAADRRPRTDIVTVGTLLAALAGKVTAALAAERPPRECEFQSRLLDAVGQAVVAWDADWRITYGNGAAEQLFGWTLDEGIGFDLRDFLPRLSPGDDARWFADLAGAGQPWSGELRLQNRLGVAFSASVDEQPLRDAAGRPAGAVAIVTDISRRTAAENALGLDEERLRTLFSELPVVMWAIDGAGVYTFMAGRTLETLGVRAEEMVGQSVNVVHAHVPSIVERHARALAGEAFSVTSKRNGVILESHYRPLHDGEGRVTGVLGLAVDVTERARIEAALRETEEFKRATFDSLDLAITVIDGAQNIVDGNRSWRRMLSEGGGTCPPGGAVGMNYFETCRQAGIYPPDVEASVRDGIDKVLAGERLQFRDEHHWALAAPEGEPRWARVSVSSLDHGSVGAIVIHEDVSERRRNAELEIRLRSSEAAERLKDDLLSTVSHELRTPLAVIRGYLSTIAEYHDRLSAADVVDLVNRSQLAADQLEKLVSDLLTLSRLAVGKLPTTRRSISLQSLVTETLAQMRVVAPGRKFMLTSRVSGARVRGDRSQLREVLYNLFDNAIKYAPAEAPIEVDVASPVAGTVSVCVRDHGAGIPAGELANIFHRFHRIRTAGNATVRGAGLGLAICRALIEAHYGRIEATLPEGGGLAMTFTLPLVEPRRAREKTPS